MWMLVRAMSSAGSKIVATFFMVLVLIMFSILFWPAGFNALNDFANVIANTEMIRNPDLSDRGVTLTRLFINEASIFGILLTLVARMVVEIIWFTTILLWRVANPKSEPQTGDEAQRYYAES